MCSELNLSVSIEEGPTTSSLRPADVLVCGLGSLPVAVDFAVVHSLQSSINLADVRPGQLAKRMESHKIVERQALCRGAGWELVPFVMETVGSWGGKGRYILQRIIRLWALQNNCAMKDAALICRTRLALVLTRALARQLERAFPSSPGSLEDD